MTNNILPIYFYMQPDIFCSSVKPAPVPLNFCLLAAVVDVRSINDFTTTGRRFGLKIMKFVVGFAKTVS